METIGVHSFLHGDPRKKIDASVLRSYLLVKADLRRSLDLLSFTLFYPTHGAHRGGAQWRQIEVERDIKVSLMHHMSVLRSIVVVLGKVRCAVHVDFWIDVQVSDAHTNEMSLL